MLTEGKYRFGRCCCFTVKTGTTIIGALQIIGSLINLGMVVMMTNDDERAKDTPFMKQIRESVPVPLNLATKSIYGIIAVITIITAILLIHGNSKCKLKCMQPWVYWNLTYLALSIILKIISVLSSTHVMKTSDIFIQLIVVVIGTVVGLLLIQVVRSRIADIEQNDRPEIPFTQRVPTN